MKKETIVLRDLSIGYGGKKGSVKTVASHINASICSGELTCLLGANGVGKSTLLRTLSAFLPKLSGEIMLQGRELSSYTEREMSRLIGIVLTSRPRVQNMTVTELVGIGRSPYTGFWGTLTHADKEVVEQSLKLVGVASLGRRTIQTLSDGERQKVMIAKALAQETPVIYLDEPTAFLDFPSKVEIMQLLRRLSRETDKTIFLSTHDFELALQIADRLWLMEKDKGVSIGTAEELANRGVLSRYVERAGIVFDKETLRVKILKE